MTRPPNPRCVKCGRHKVVICEGDFTASMIPQRCDVSPAEATGTEKFDCGQSPYEIIPDKCSYVDQQTLKLQEVPEAVPTGEMPRSVTLTVERGLVDFVSPGARISVLGVYSLFDRSDNPRSSEVTIAAIRIPYVKVVGIEADTSGHRKEQRFTPREEEIFATLSRRADIHHLLATSIAPSIQGEYTSDVKKALACQLIGGCKKTLPDGTKLRGDINILLLGDPSTAKSQFLKFVQKVAPVGVYTSGKGSSAAGLTASVIRDRNKEFFLEGGAMVLADGGICCIDEFDKMREADRVAIHEAMEQQTISIAKAGITTVLNSRTSVLAAANPIFGRYDDLRSTAENIDMMSTILSRFDCIFIVRDIRDESRDIFIAKHVMGVHMKASDSARVNDAPEVTAGQSSHEHLQNLELSMLRDYISFCRSRCSPRLDEETSALLASEYVLIRSAIKQRAEEAGGPRQLAVPITIRQLEALVRLAESLAKMRLNSKVDVADVYEALRLFKMSTMTAASVASPASGAEMRFLADDERAQIQNAEQFVKQRVPIGADASTMRLLEEGIVLGHSDFALRRALNIMNQRTELSELSQGRRVRRLR